MNTPWKNFVRLAQLRFEADDCPHYDNLIIIKQDVEHDNLLVMNDGLQQKLCCLSYWNDIYISRSCGGKEGIIKVAKQLIEDEKQRGEF